MRDTNEIVKEIYQEQGKIMQSVKDLVRVYKEGGGNKILLPFLF